MKHISSAFTAIRRSPYQAVAATLLLSITFFVGYSFSLLLYSAEHILQYFETRPQITGFFLLDADQATIDQAKKTMESKEYVEHVNIVTKEKALELFREDNRKDPYLLELVTADILPASIEVSSKDVNSLNKIKADVEKLQGIEEAKFEEDVVDKLRMWTNTLRTVGLGSIGVLVLESFLLITIITGMRVVTKRRAIQIMRILGATKWYVKAPFVYEGMIYGIFGSILGWSMMYVGLLYLTPWLQTYLEAIPLFPIPLEVFGIQAGIGTLLGMLLGAFASSVAVQRMMRRL